MGYDLERFTGDIDEELKCPICCGVLEDPVQACQCEHAYCTRCIDEWLKTSESCPVDRSPLKSAQLQPIPRIVRNLLNHLHIKCDFTSAGCTDVVRMEDLPNHRSGCPYNPEFPVPCPKGCGAQVPKNTVEKHDCVRDLRDMLCRSQKEVNELKGTVTNLYIVAEEQKEIARNNNLALMNLGEKYEHLKSSISNLENPIRQILLLAARGEITDEMTGEKNGGNRAQVKDLLAEETTTEVYISNLNHSVTPTTLQQYLTSKMIKVISCKQTLVKGWKNDYIVSIFKSDSVKILQPNLWPKGIGIFICGDYYSTKTEGTREGPTEGGVDSANMPTNSGLFLN